MKKKTVFFLLCIMFYILCIVNINNWYSIIKKNIPEKIYIYNETYKEFVLQGPEHLQQFLNEQNIPDPRIAGRPFVLDVDGVIGSETNRAWNTYENNEYHADSIENGYASE